MSSPDSPLLTAISRGGPERSLLADEDLTMTVGSDLSFEEPTTTLSASVSAAPAAQSAAIEDAFTYKGSMGALPTSLNDTLATPGPANGKNATRSRWMDVDDVGDLTDEQRVQVEALLEERDQVRGINEVLEGLVHEMNALLIKVEAFKGNAKTSEELLNLYTRLASQAEHSTNLILDPQWQGMAADMAELERVERERIEAEERAAEQRAAEERAAIEAAQAKELEDLRAKERQKLASTKGAGRGARGRIPSTTSTGLGAGRGTATRGASSVRGVRGVRGRGRA